jgi:hypothetical protein
LKNRLKHDGYGIRESGKTTNRRTFKPEFSTVLIVQRFDCNHINSSQLLVYYTMTTGDKDELEKAKVFLSLERIKSP